MKKKSIAFGSVLFLAAVVFVSLSLVSLTACQSTNTGTGRQETKLLYQGHSSFRFTAKNGTVIYLDPFAPSGYDLPADLVLVTHQHGDHNQVQLVTQKPDCVVITQDEALAGGKHNTFTVKGVVIEAVEAYNDWHQITEAVGYIITIDGIKVYAAGDTSTTGQMKTFAAEKLDYAFLPCDGVFNMDGNEAGECAKTINAKHTIPIHTGPFDENYSPLPGFFDNTIAEKLTAPNLMILEPGQEIVLAK